LGPQLKKILVELTLLESIILRATSVLGSGGQDISAGPAAEVVVVDVVVAVVVAAAGHDGLLTVVFLKVIAAV